MKSTGRRSPNNLWWLDWIVVHQCSISKGHKDEMVCWLKDNLKTKSMVSQITSITLRIQLWYWVLCCWMGAAITWAIITRSPRVGHCWTSDGSIMCSRLQQHQPMSEWLTETKTHPLIFSDCYALLIMAVYCHMILNALQQWQGQQIDQTPIRQKLEMDK